MSKSSVGYKIFVRETSQVLASSAHPHPSISNTSLSGEEAKQFYEEVTKSVKNIEPSSEAVVSQAIQCSVKRRKKNLQVPNLNIFRAAQENNVKSISQLINSNADINIRDEFGWTGLMCATCSGSEEVVKLLVEAGADVNTRDRSGYNAISLAEKNNHYKIVNFLRNYKVEPTKNISNFPKTRNKYFCHKCNASFSSTKIEHETSTLHLFQDKVKERVFFGIPEKNRGFQLLVRHGWDKESGLGREGNGRKFPIKARVKKDRCGVGAINRTEHITTVATEKRHKRYLSEREFRREFL